MDTGVFGGLCYTRGGVGGAGGVILGVTQTSTPHPSTAALEDYSLTNLKKTRSDTDAGVGLSA